jgi:uncharacterized glyoxalase superfamily protein PhnB
MSIFIDRRSTNDAVVGRTKLITINEGIPTMSTQPIPPGLENLIPHLTCTPAADAIEFYKKAFGAEELHRMPEPGGGSRLMHAAIRIGSSHVFLVDDFPEYCGGKCQSPKALQGTPVTLHRYVADVDAAVKRAVDAGATVLMPVSDMFWGDRYGVITDPFGHNWSLATHIKDMTPDEMAAGMMEACTGDK